MRHAAQEFQWGVAQCVPPGASEFYAKPLRGAKHQTSNFKHPTPKGRGASELRGGIAKR
jgi:hypothetical protein